MSSPSMMTSPRLPARRVSVIDLRTLQDVVARIVSEMDSLCGLEQIIEVGNAVDLGPVYNDTLAVTVANRIRWSLVRELALAVTRLLDPPRGDRATLPRVFRDLRDPALRAELIDNERMRLRVIGVDVEQMLGEVTREWQAFVDGPHQAGGGAMREARNVYQAHNLLTPVTQAPSYGELDGVLRAVRPMVAQLGVLTGVYLNGFDATSSIWRERAECFWRAQLQIRLPKHDED
jgi:hypothetical protein